MNNLDKDDIEFLQELAHELNTQDVDCCADPVFWGVGDYRVSSDNEGEYCCLYDTQNCEPIFEEHIDSIDDLKETLINDFDVVEEYIKDFQISDLLEYAVEELDGLEIRNYDLEHFITDQTGAFLTKRAAKKHIEGNKHHYTNKVHTYGMTAWRNPEFERLIKIIKKFDTKKDENCE